MAPRNTDQFVIIVLYIVSITIGNSFSEINSKNGVCKKTEVVTKLRYYTYNKWVEESYRDPDCLVFKCTLQRRVQRTFHKYATISEPQQSSDCCPGYKQINNFYYEELKCVPMCSNNCEHGVCTGPEECTCDLGYHVDPNNRYKCIPLCKKGCAKYESCIAPNVCKCMEGYSNIYSIECQPICEDPCPTNSICTSPNKCECSPGYKPSNQSFDCEPICSSGCLNGNCVSPGECKCHKGWAMRTTNNSENENCQPICSIPCVNGTCVAPDTCECSLGYKLLANNTCVPDCSEGCDNGKCVGPETCECLPGYQKNEDGVCKPVCSNKCVNGVCVSPETCVCKNGWQIKETITTNDQICEPICKNPCVNGSCVAPDVCNCFPGYVKSKEIRENITYEICKPHCSKGCYNGTCVSPENCTCNNGWRLHETNETELNICLPICNKMCVYGTCVGPDTCECLSGYKKSKNVTAGNICEPHCLNGCPHGTCISPNNCVCDEGWHLTIVNQAKFIGCKPNCQKVCLHDMCISEDSCECLSVESFVCGPHCSNGCPNGRCIAPETCICDIGWVMTEGNATKNNLCQPVCKQPCVNGKCVAPDDCECLSGYKKPTQDTNTTLCGNGTCISSKKMGININTCEPICNKTCINSTCVAPNTCECLPGYKQCTNNVSKDNICELHCSLNHTTATGITEVTTETSASENLQGEKTNVTRAEMFIKKQWLNYNWLYTISGALIGSLLVFALVMIKLCGKKYNISEEALPPEIGMDFITQPKWTYVRSYS